MNNISSDEYLIDLFYKEVNNYIMFDRIFQYPNKPLMKCQIINIYFDSIVHKICKKLNPQEDIYYDIINQIIE